tara:strand:+ start:381 stop:1127 length:747 start_codon:yes stop_codon:yes gene_type:complete
MDKDCQLIFEAYLNDELLEEGIKEWFAKVKSTYDNLNPLAVPLLVLISVGAYIMNEPQKKQMLDAAIGEIERRDQINDMIMDFAELESGFKSFRHSRAQEKKGIYSNEEIRQLELELKEEMVESKDNVRKLAAYLHKLPDTTPEMKKELEKVAAADEQHLNNIISSRESMSGVEGSYDAEYFKKIMAQIMGSGPGQRFAKHSRGKFYHDRIKKQGKEFPIDQMGSAHYPGKIKRKESWYPAGTNIKGH